MTRELRRIARSIGATPAQLALAWLLRHDNVIDDSADEQRRAHALDNRHAASLQLPGATLAELDAAFPPPSRARPLAVI